jgi:class 3 adenylate cyclase
MVVVCEHCGVESPPEFRFCPACGGALPAEGAAPRQTRKVITALFCDITGSTALGEQLDPEVLKRVLNRYFAAIRQVIERHGGTVENFVGDAVMAVFGIPRVREDDALRAVRAAAEIRDALPAIAAEVGVALRFRTGVNTGPVLMGEGENLAIGDAVNVAARLEQAAAPGDIVLGEETLRLVRDAVEVEALAPLELKGKSEPVAAFRLLAVDPAAPGVARHLDAPLVGRERELRLLGEAWERVVSESGCHLFTLLGTAGVGKSRLVAELLAAVSEDANVLRGRCLHYGEGITFWPLVEALMPVGEPAAAMIEYLGGGGAASPEELFWDARKLLESLALERPVILYVDDLQWAEPMLLDLLDHVSDLSRGAPILLLCTARPELLEDRPGWAGGKLNATTVLLEPLGSGDAACLLDRLGEGLGAEARARILAASGGNPLFLEEMTALARDRGAVTVPPTIQALLAARLERLALEEREVLERGAIEGEVFHRLAVRALAGERLGAGVESRLAGLVRKELIRPHRPTLEGDEAFRFRHLLIRDAAYEGLPKAMRAELHERFAFWLEHNGGSLVELDEIAGWHLEQALRYRRELGGKADPALSHRAAEHLYVAGRRAGERYDIAAARNLLERAFALAEEGEAQRARIAVELAPKLIEAGEHDRIEALLSTAEGTPEVAAEAALVRLEWLLHNQTEQAFAMIDARLPAILADLERLGDERGLARAYLAAMRVQGYACRARAAGELALLAMQHAKMAGDEGLRCEALGWYIGTLNNGDRSAGEVAAELDAIERDAPSRRVGAWINYVRGYLAMLDGRFDDAARLARESTDVLTDTGLVLAVAGGAHLSVEIRRSAGDLRGALAILEEADRILAGFGERTYRSTTQAHLAEVHQELGDRDATEAAIGLSEQLGVPEDIINFTITHRVRAELALADGNLQEAEQWARSAVDYAFRTDYYDSHATTLLTLARVLAQSGTTEQAAAEARAALALMEAKGDKPRAAQARAMLAGLSVQS